MAYVNRRLQSFICWCKWNRFYSFHYFYYGSISTLTSNVNVNCDVKEVPHLHKNLSRSALWYDIMCRFKLYFFGNEILHFSHDGKSRVNLFLTGLTLRDSLLIEATSTLLWNCSMCVRKFDSLKHVFWQCGHSYFFLLLLWISMCSWRFHRRANVLSQILQHIWRAESKKNKNSIDHSYSYFIRFHAFMYTFHHLFSHMLFAKSSY